MNEELKILIKVVSDEAKKNLSAVKKELDGIKKEGNESGKAVDKAMSGIAKGVAVAIGSIVALTTAMAQLGRSAQDVQKGFEKLNTTFQNAGSTTKQAASTYKQLFGFLGDHDKAIETAQSLALITNEEKKLSQWSNILMGAWAEMGDKLPIEGLAEAANETINVGQVVGVMADALTWAGISEDGFNQALANTVTLEEREALVRNTLNGLYANSAQLYSANNKATIEYNTAQANLNITLASLAQHLTPLLTSIATLGNVMLTALGPAIQTVALYLTAFIQLIAEAIQWVGSFFGLFGSSTEKTTSDVKGYQNAMSSYMASLRNYFGGTGKGIDENTNKVKALKKQLMGFDELNVVSNPATSSAPGSDIPPGPMPTAPNPADFGIGSGIDFSDMKKDLEEVKEKLKGILLFVGLVGAGFLAWKMTTVIPTLVEAVKLLFKFKGNLEAIKAYEQIVGGNTSALLGKLKTMGGYLLTAAGAMLLLYGYSDSWANGIDWGNLITMVSGAALAVAGLYMSFGPVAAIIGTVVAGIALLVAGVKDFIKQGPKLENVLTIIGSAVAIGVALGLAFGPVVGIIAGVIALLGGLVVAIGFEKEAILSSEEAHDKHTETINTLISAEQNYTNIMDAAEKATKRLLEAEEKAGMTGEELYNQVKNGTLTYQSLNAEQKELYKAYLDNETAQQKVIDATKQLEDAKTAEKKAAWESRLAVAKESDTYDDFKKSVVEAFEKSELTAEEARDLIEKSMSEMGESAQQTFMSDLPGAIKDGMDPNRYETTKKKMADWFAGVGKSFIENIWTPVKNFWNQKIAPIFTAQWWRTKFGAIKEGARNVLNGIIVVIETALNAIIGKANGLSWDIPDWIPLIGGKTFGFSLPKVSIPRLEAGGIATSSVLANIGERGREAVLPLENHTEWMDTLADKIAMRNAAPSKIVLMVDSKELGWANIHSINNITRQTGQLQLVF